MQIEILEKISKLTRNYVFLFFFQVIGEVEGCQRGWTQYKNGCYRVIEDVEATFVNGIEQCAYNDATLTSITDEESLSFLTGLLTNNGKEFFIGLSAWGINDTYVNTRGSDLFIQSVSYLIYSFFN